MNPAPTLLDEWITNQAFWGFLFLVAFAGVVYYGTEFLKRMHAAREDDTPEHPWPMRLCPGHDYEAVDGNYVCAHCGDVVRQPLNCAGRHRYVETKQSLLCTVCGYRTALPYDQDLDQATDLGQWNKEMDAS